VILATRLCALFLALRLAAKSSMFSLGPYDLSSHAELAQHRLSEAKDIYRRGLA
jgi:hypothetical protein